MGDAFAVVTGEESTAALLAEVGSAVLGPSGAVGGVAAQPLTTMAMMDNAESRRTETPPLRVSVGLDSHLTRPSKRALRPAQASTHHPRPADTRPVAIGHWLGHQPEGSFRGGVSKRTHHERYERPT